MSNNIFQLETFASERVLWSESLMFQDTRRFGSRYITRADWWLLEHAKRKGRSKLKVKKKR